MEAIRLENIDAIAKALGSSKDNLKEDGKQIGIHIEWNNKAISISANKEFSREFTFPVELDEVEDWMRDLEELLAYS